MEVSLFPSVLEFDRMAGFSALSSLLQCGRVSSLSDMANIEDLWSRFSLTEEEEHEADVPQKKEVTIVRLAAKLFLKRVVNAKVVGRTFKPLWKPIREMKSRDIGGNILLFEFDDTMDLERVLEFEPWSYDKSIVDLRRAVDVKSAPSLDFDSMTF